jgi:hypothetical protein
MFIFISKPRIHRRRRTTLTIEASETLRMEPMTMSLIGIQIHTFRQAIRLTTVVNLKYDDTVALTSSDGRCNDFERKV